MNYVCVYGGVVWRVDRPSCVSSCKLSRSLLTAVTGWVTTQRSRGTYHRSDTHTRLLGERWVRQAVLLPKIHQMKALNNIIIS